MLANVMTLLRRLALLTAILFFGACASSPKIYSNVDDGADFTAYRTFGFFAELATDKPGYESTESRYLKAAATEEMRLRNYSLSDNPDLLINFHINTKEKIYSRQTPTMGGYYGYRGSYYGAWGGYETRIDQYTEGTLNIDIVDARTRTLVWEGAIVGRLNEDALDYLEEALHVAVHEIFKRFPVMPDQATSPAVQL